MSELLAGEVFAGFRVEEVLGHGGMGWVYRIHDLRLDRERALKVLDPSLARDEGFRGRFEREMRMAAKVEHPAVVPVYHAGEEDGRLFIVMRLIRGPDLQKLVANEGPLDARRTARVVSAVAGGLDAAHGHGIVHRDVKPANVLLELGSEGERVFLTDFGIGRPSEAAGGLTSTGEVVGTADYIAPEQIRGRRADSRSDVYTLGCVACYLLTGEPPFARENQLATLYAHANAERPRPSLLEPGLPPAIDDVVARATAIDPDERFQTAGDLASALTAALAPTATGSAAPVPAGASTSPLTHPPTAPLASHEATVPVADAGAPPLPPGEATTRLPPERAEKRPRPSWIPLALIAAIAAAVVVFVVVQGGDEEGGAGDGGSRNGSSGGGAELDRITNVVDFDVTDGAPTSALVAGVNNVLVLAEAESLLYPVEPGSGGLGRAPQEIPDPSSIAIGFESYWVASRSEGALFRFGPGSREVPDQIDVGSAPSDVAIDIRATAETATVNHVWVANEGNSTLSRVDPSALAEDATVPLDSPPSAIAAGDGGVWALSEAAGTVTQIDPAAARDPGAPVELEGSPVDIAGDSVVWVADSTGTLIRLSPELEPIGEPTELTGTPVAVTAGLNAVWVVTRDPSRLIEIERASGDPVAEAVLEGEPTAVSVPPADSVDPRSIWVATEDGTVSRIRP